jgi:hypothetical protein
MTSKPVSIGSGFYLLVLNGIPNYKQHDVADKQKGGGYFGYKHKQLNYPF